MWNNYTIIYRFRKMFDVLIILYYIEKCMWYINYAKLYRYKKIYDLLIVQY